MHANEVTYLQYTRTRSESEGDAVPGVRLNILSDFFFFSNQKGEFDSGAASE